MTLVSFKDIITIKIDKKKYFKNLLKPQENKLTKRLFKKKILGCQKDIRETNSDYEIEKRKFENIHLKNFV